MWPPRARRGVRASPRTASLSSSSSHLCCWRRPARTPAALMKNADRAPRPDQLASLPKSRRICSRTFESGSWPRLLPPTITSFGPATATCVRAGTIRAVASATTPMSVFMSRLLAAEHCPYLLCNGGKPAGPAPAHRHMPPEPTRGCEGGHTTAKKELLLPALIGSRYDGACRVAPSARRRLCSTLAARPRGHAAGQKLLDPHELRRQDAPREVRMTSLRHVALGLLAAGSIAPAAFAQAPSPTAPTAANPWFQGAPFPEASEEVLGATAGGKVYVFAGLAPGWKPKAMVYEYDPAANQWTKKKPMRLASHHVAFATLNDKIYAFGGFTYPESGPPGWNPVDNAWEYDPAADEWKA